MTSFDLHATADHYQLGNLVETINWSKPKIRSAIFDNAIYLAVCIGLVSTVIGMQSGELLVLAALVGVPLLCGGFFLHRIIRQFKRFRTRAISLFEQGCIDERFARPKVLLYQDVAEIWQYQVNVRGGGYFSQYHLKQKDGDTWYIDETLEAVDHTGPFLQEACLIHQFPPAFQTFKSGGSLEFGIDMGSHGPKISVSQAGIVHKKKLLPWADLDSLEIRRGDFILSGEGFHRHISIAEMNNVHLLLALIKEIKPSVLDCI